MAALSYGGPSPTFLRQCGQALTVHEHHTEILSCRPNTDITVEGNTVEAVTEFQYLGPYSHPPADATQIYTDALVWPPLPCKQHAMQRCWRQQTEIEFGHQTATLLNLCYSDSAVWCQHMDPVGK